MKTITCKSCGSTVKVTFDSQKCSVCETELWGHTSETLPKDIQSIISFASLKKKNNWGATGWLILYNEGKESVVYNLKQGENLIGRANPDTPPDIAIENDEFISRNHAILNVSIDPFGQFVYTLNDNKSLNGTYLNGNADAIVSEAPYELRDGDTVQVGSTKLVLKIITESSNQEDALDFVKKMEQHQTVQISNVRKTAIITKIIK